jgi:hypothetical protein
MFETRIIEVSLSILEKVLSAFVISAIGYFFVTKPTVRISKKFAKGLTDAVDHKEIAFKFKIVNTSHFFKARHFVIELFAVKKVPNGDGTYTEDCRPIVINYGGLKELSTYVSKKKIAKLTEKTLGKSFSCWYRIITTENILEDYKDYDLFRITVQYSNSMNREFLIEQYFKNKKDKIVTGEFSNDGDVDSIYPLSEENAKELSEIEKARSLRAQN